MESLFSIRWIWSLLWWSLSQLCVYRHSEASLIRWVSFLHALFSSVHYLGIFLRGFPLLHCLIVAYYGIELLVMLLSWIFRPLDFILTIVSDVVKFLSKDLFDFAICMAQKEYFFATSSGYMSFLAAFWSAYQRRSPFVQQMDRFAFNFLVALLFSFFDIFTCI